MENKGETQTQEELNAFVAEELGSGKNRTAVVRELVQSGMTESEAQQVVERIMFQLRKTAEEEEFSGEVLVPVLLGGLIAAVVGGAIWGAIAIWTGYEIGYVAWGVGVLCGLGVVMMSQGKRGMPLQIVAVAASVLGILIGKYVAFYDIVKDVVAKESGAEAVSMFSMNMVQFFEENLTTMARGFDALWIVLAIYTAWSIPKASG